MIPDPLYHSHLITRLINRVMQSGKKTIAQRHVYGALEIIRQKTKKEPLDVFQQALENVKPSMEVRSRRVGGAFYQVPVSVRGDRKESLAMRWIIAAAKARPSKEYHSFGEKLAAELLAAANNEGGAVKKRVDTLRMADANKAFAHFRW